MRITMRASRYGCEDGYVVQRYEQGETYDVTDRLARSFIARGYAVPAGALSESSHQLS